MLHSFQAVVLGIASVLAISVLQKSRQIGILKAMGVKDSTASFIFLSQGLLGVIGSILGVLLGLLLAYSFTIFAVNPDGTPVVGRTLVSPSPARRINSCSALLKSNPCSGSLVSSSRFDQVNFFDRQLLCSQTGDR